MVEDDGMIHATCEYCSTVYKIDPAEIEQPAA
jgi:molecular chaperone Hsp33